MSVEVASEISVPAGRRRQQRGPAPLADAVPAAGAAAVAISVRWKAAVSLTLVLLGVAAAMSSAVAGYERRFLTAEGQKRARAMALQLALAARDPLLTADELRLGPLIDAIMASPDVALAYVFDHRDVVVFDSRPERIGRQRRVEVYSEPVLVARAPIVVDSILVGGAVVALRADFVRRASLDAVRRLLVPLAAWGLAGGLVVLALVSVHVRRIERLDTAVERVARGDLGARVSVHGRDELGRLARRFNRMVERLEAAGEEIERGFAETISALAAAIEAKDSYTRGHCERVAQLSVAIARRLGAGEAELRDLELAAILHDVGKIGVDFDVLGKPGRLTPSELEAMKQHPEIGARILSPLSFLERVAEYVTHHHEDWDGSGYPAGLAGEEIPLAARIIHLVDAYDAMTSSRPYRRALPRSEALERLRAASGTQFDPRVAAAFFELETEGVVAEIVRGVETPEASGQR